jgi:hypothetical protein
MSIVKNSVLAGNGLTADQSSSVVIWPSVVVSGVTYTFCEYITTNEVGNPKYIRDIPHLAIVRPTGHDYYPCHNGSTYGLYDKVNHTFTAKTLHTVEPHGEDQPYGVGIWDLMWATASGYTDLLFLAAADGGTDTNTPFSTPEVPYQIADIKFDGSDVYQGLSFIHYGVYLDRDTIAIPPDKIDGDGYRHTYSHMARLYDNNPYNLPIWDNVSLYQPYDNGELLLGRKCKWIKWADGAPKRIYLRTFTDITKDELRMSILDTNGEVPLSWWDKYNPASVHAPFARVLNSGGTGDFTINYHGGKYYNPTYRVNAPTTNTNDAGLYLYDNSIEANMILNAGIGNIIDWVRPNTWDVKIMAFNSVVSIPRILDGDRDKVIITTKKYRGDGEFSNDTIPANCPPFGYNSSNVVKSIARDGLNTDNSVFNYAAGGVVNIAVATAMYNAFVSNNWKVDALIDMMTSAAGSHVNGANIKRFVDSLKCSLSATHEFSKAFIKDQWVKTNHGSYGLYVSPAVNHDGGLGLHRSAYNYVDNDYHTTQLADNWGLVFALTYKDSSYHAYGNSSNEVYAILESSFVDNNTGDLLGYSVAVKKCAKGIRHFNKDSSDPYAKTQWSYLDNGCERGSVMSYVDEYYNIYPRVAVGDTAPSPINVTDYVGSGDALAKCNATLYSVVFGPSETNKPTPPTGHDLAITTEWSFNNSGGVFIIPNSITDAEFSISTNINDNDVRPHAIINSYKNHRGFELDFRTNGEKIFIYSYDVNQIDGKVTVYFKRYKVSGSTAITDFNSSPNSSMTPITEIALLASCQAVENGSTVGSGGGRFVANGTNKWQLHYFKYEGGNSLTEFSKLYLGPSVNDTYSAANITANLEYIPTLNTEYLCTPLIEGVTLQGSYVCDRGVFKLELEAHGIGLSADTPMYWALAHIYNA